jgi:hypothetical protein
LARRFRPRLGFAIRLTAHMRRDRRCILVEAGFGRVLHVPERHGWVRMTEELLQRLTLGEAFTISGSIFLAAAWRPGK